MVGIGKLGKAMLPVYLYLLFGGNTLWVVDIY